MKQHLRGVFGAAIGSATDKPIRTPDEIETRLRLPVLGQIERIPKSAPNRYAPQLVTIQDPCSLASAAYHALRVNVHNRCADQPLHTLLVTSPEPAEGKSAVAANLAVAMAQAGQEVVLLDADLRQPQVRRLFAQRAGQGLIQTLQDEDWLWVRALVVSAVKNLMTVTAYPAATTGNPSTIASEPEPLDPVEVLGSPRMRALMQHLQEVSDLVVVNAPALTATETRPLASQADGAILVMEHGLTRRQAAQRAVGHLHEAGTHVLGAVLTEMPARDDKGVAPGMLRFAGRACKAVSGVGPRLLRRTPYPPRSGGGALGDSAPRNDG